LASYREVDVETLGHFTRMVSLSSQLNTLTVRSAYRQLAAVTRDNHQPISDHGQRLTMCTSQTPVGAVSLLSLIESTCHVVDDATSDSWSHAAWPSVVVYVQLFT